MTERPVAQRIERDVVFSALTRPQMLLGVPYSVLVLNVIVTAELFLVFRSILIVGVTFVLHLAGAAMTARDARLLDVWLVRLRCTPRVRNFKAWRCNSYRP